MSNVALREDRPLDVDGFLAFLDGRPNERWELLDGVPIAMVGGTRAHAIIAGNLLERVRPLARSRDCDAHARFFVQLADSSLLEPDLLVDCTGGHRDDRATREPTIVFEVLSPSTMHFDRSEKARRYRAVVSLKQLVFVYQDSVRVESWLRQEEGWLLEPVVLMRRSASLALPALGASLPLEAVYLGAVPTSGDD